MKKVLIILSILLFTTSLYASKNVPKDVQVLSTNSCGKDGYNTCLTVRDTKTSEIYVIMVWDSRIEYVCKTGMKQKNK